MTGKLISTFVADIFLSIIFLSKNVRPRAYHGQDHYDAWLRAKRVPLVHAEENVARLSKLV